MAVQTVHGELLSADFPDIQGKYRENRRFMGIRRLVARGKPLIPWVIWIDFPTHRSREFRHGIREIQFPDGNVRRGWRQSPRRRRIFHDGVPPEHGAVRNPIAADRKSGGFNRSYPTSSIEASG
jgi:hypothetical protein